MLTLYTNVQYALNNNMLFLQIPVELDTGMSGILDVDNPSVCAVSSVCVNMLVTVST